MRYRKTMVDSVRAMLDCILIDAQKTAESLASASTDILSGHASSASGGVRLSAEQRRRLQARIRAALQANPLCNGAGFASHAQESGLDTGYWTLEWWRQEAEAIQQVQLERNQDARQRLDFRSFDWFDRPARCHRPVVDGPYVDYVCNSAYTITCAHPVLLGNCFAGVAAVDILVATLEKLVLPALGAIGLPALVVNADARVVTSAMRGVRPGSLWKGPCNDSSTFSSNAHPLRLVVVDRSGSSSIAPGARAGAMASPIPRVPVTTMSISKGGVHP